jgi:hypothetical protein
VELVACLHWRQAPLDCETGPVAPMVPQAGCVGPRCLSGTTTLHPGLRPRGPRACGPSEPTACCRCRGPLTLLGQGPGWLRRPSWGKRPGRGGRQILLPQTAPVSSGSRPRPQRLPPPGLSEGRTSGAPVARAQAALGGAGQQHPAGALPSVCLRRPQGPPRLPRPWPQDGAPALPGTRVTAQQGPPGRRRSGLGREHGCQRPARGPAPRPHAPAVLAPRCAATWFHAVRTRSTPRAATPCQAPPGSARSCSGQRACPSGGAGPPGDRGGDARGACEGGPPARWLFAEAHEGYWGVVAVLGAPLRDGGEAAPAHGGQVLSTGWGLRQPAEARTSALPR